MKFLHAVGPIAIFIAVWQQLIAENKRKIWHIVQSLWQTTVFFLEILSFIIIADFSSLQMYFLPHLISFHLLELKLKKEI